MTSSALEQVKRFRWRRIAAFLLLAVLGVVAGDHARILVHLLWIKRVNPSSSALIAQRTEETSDRPLKQEMVWVAYEHISGSLVRAVLAGEDSRFFDHEGFDWEEIQKAMEKDWEEKGFRRGASTISQQLAKNLYLSTSKNPLRKLHEALITWEMEHILTKRRILEIYLNVIEWGEGIYGAEAASQHYFHRHAASLSADQAAFLAALIPNPRTAYNPSKHPARVDRRKNLILRLMAHTVIPRDLN